jgi:SAM-dependent methyltransferase
VTLAREAAAAQGMPALFQAGDVREPPYPDAAFDLVTDRGCLHHLAEDDRAAYAAAIGRVLRPGGLLYVRGSAVRRFPFVPVTAAELERWFAPPAFEVLRVLPVTLVTDAGPIEGNAGLIERR